MGSAAPAAEDEVFVLPASSAQMRMWFLDRLAPESTAYNMPGAMRLRGALDLRALTRALAGVVRRHEVLRTALPAIGGEPVQLVRPAAPAGWPLVDLSALPEAVRVRAADRIARAEARRRFDLARGPLLRTLLLRLAGDEHLALCTLHHAVSDGWSLGVLLREIGAGYAAALEGRDTPLPELPLQYADYAAWQRKWLEGPQAARQLEYWRERLAGAPVLDLPTDRPRPAEPGSDGASRSFHLSPVLLRAVRELGGRQGATPMMTLLAVFQVLLARYTGQTDVVVGTLVAGRNRRELEELIGLFVNTLALRTDLSSGPTFREALARVRETVLAAQANQDLPFDRVVEALRSDADPRRNPLFEVLFAYVSAPREEVRLPSLTLSAAGTRSPTTRFDLELHLVEGSDGVDGTLVYRAELYQASTVERMVRHFVRLLEGALAAPDAALRELPLLEATELEQVVRAWNRREAYRAGPCLHQLLEAQAERAPDAVAVVFEAERLSYGELNRRANQLAHHLRGRGVGPEVRVGLCLERGVEMVVALLAVLKAGGAYVPLDPAYPAERLAFTLSDAGVHLLLTQQGLRATIPALDGVDVLCLDAAAAQVRAGSTANPESGATPASLAYVIYTSGSTGRPKGVQVEHGNVARLFSATEAWFGFSDQDVWTLFHSYAFDFSVWELWGALLYGGRVVVVPSGVSRDPEAFHALVQREGVTVLNQTPSSFRQFMRVDAERGGALALREVIFGGEALEPAGLREWARRRGLERPRLVNMYGITETTVHVTYRPLSEADVFAGEGSPIGVRIPDLSLYVLDAVLQPVPVGVPGELYVGGAGVARGYLDRPGLTAQRFVPDAFSGEPGARLYRTGDRVRWRADGTLEYQGRLDEQVKVRGFRIELGEIEALLRSEPGVADCAVVAREDAPGEKRLVAYVVGAVHPEVLRDRLRGTLPEHMVPSALVVLDALPLTANGKLDRRALPAPEYGTSAERYVAPRTPVEDVLAGIWAELLQAERVGVEASFFELGGHSLLATRVVSRVREVFAVELPLSALFEGPTVAALAGRVEELRRAGMPGPAPVERVDSAAPLPLSFPQERLWFLHRAEDTGAGYTIPVGVRIEGEGLDADALERAFSMVVDRHEVLRTVFPVVDGGARQRILDPAPFTLPRVDLRDRPEERRDAEVARLALRLAEEPYDLERGVLLRALLVRTGPATHVLLVNLHHIVFDGWSVGVLVREITACYEAVRGGREPSLPALPVQYADYAAWQREWARSPAAAAQLAYWKRQLADVPALDLARGRPRPEKASYRGGALPVRLGPELSGRVRASARERQSTVFMFLLAAFKVVLAHHGSARDLVVGTDLAGRVRAELEPLIGFFINEVVLRTDLSGDPSLGEVLDRVRGVALDAYRNQDLPFALVVRELAGERSLGATPLFQVMFGMDNTPYEAVEVDGLQMAPVDTSSGVSPWELSLYLRETASEIEGIFRFRTDLLDPSTVEDLRSDFLSVVETLCGDPGGGLEKLLGELSAGGRARWEERARDLEEASRLRLKRVRRQGIPVPAE